MSYTHTGEETATVSASADVLFDYLDDRARLGTYMEKPSMTMMGGRMIYQFDETIRARRGIRHYDAWKPSRHRTVRGRSREPPWRKMWETRGRPRIPIIHAYRMGFEIVPVGASCNLRVFIEYDLPPTLGGQILGWLFAPMYARWCVRRMAQDARRQFQ